MNYGLLDTASLKISDCLVLGLFSDNDFPEIAQKIDHQHNKLISRLFSKLHEAGDFLWQADIEGHSLLLVHCGLKKEFNAQALTKQLKEIIPLLIKQAFLSVSLCLPNLVDHDANWQVKKMLRQIDARLYQPFEFKTKNIKVHKLEKILFYLPNAEPSAIKEAQAIAEGIKLARTLADLPSNVCTPTYLGEQAIALAQLHENMTIKIMGFEEIKNLGMGALLAVAQGSQEEPRFIEMQYCGGGDTPPIVLVGKGITFDSGGLSLKPGMAMEEMKYDMAGAAAVMGTLKACALMKLPINLIGLIPSTENMLSASSVKPGDIVTSMSGQTIEIINTDAEGRLILADALTYAERFKPRFVIDIATLTGGIIIALGHLMTGLMTKDDELAEQILKAAKESEDRVWRMPLDDDYQEALDSPFADMINGAFDRSASSITAACFLSRFTPNYPWAHLDVAGTAWVSGKNRIATGRPIALLIQFLHQVIHAR